MQNVTLWPLAKPGRTLALLLNYLIVHHLGYEYRSIVEVRRVVLKSQPTTRTSWKLFCQPGLATPNPGFQLVSNIRLVRCGLYTSMWCAPRYRYPIRSVYFVAS